MSTISREFSGSYFREVDRANFIQIDPLAIGRAGRGQGLYLYVMANPLVRIDPDGREGFFSGYGDMGSGLGGIGNLTDFDITHHGVGLGLIGAGFAEIVPTPIVPAPPIQDPGAAPGTQVQTMAWLYDETDNLVAGFVRAMMDKRGGRKTGIMSVGISAHGKMGPDDFTAAIENELKVAEIALRAKPGNVCVSDWNVTTHRGGIPGDITFRSEARFEANYVFGASDGGVRFGLNPPTGSMRSLGQILKKRSCQPCTIGVYTCTFGKSEESLKDLAKASGCTVYGTTTTNQVGVGGWFMDYAGSIAKASPGGGTDKKEKGPVGEANASKATLQSWWEGG